MSPEADTSTPSVTMSIAANGATASISVNAVWIAALPSDFGAFGGMTIASSV
jgi:hypothetical protein